MGQSQKWRWSDRQCCWTGHWPKDRSLNYWLGRNRRSSWIPTRDPNRLMHPHPMPSTGRCWSHVRRDLGCWWSGKILHRPSRRTPAIRWTSGRVEEGHQQCRSVGRLGKRHLSHEDEGRSGSIRAVDPHRGSPIVGDGLTRVGSRIHQRSAQLQLADCRVSRVREFGHQLGLGGGG